MSGFEGTNTRTCSIFYGAGCALYRDLFQDLTTLGGLPDPPPPPIPPLDTLTEISPVRIFFSKGPSPNMNIDTVLSGDSGVADAADPGLRRARALSDEDEEIIDATDDQSVIDMCTSVTDETLCETNGRENAVSFTP